MLNREFGIHSVPTRRTVYAIHCKFMETDSVADTKRSGRLRSGCSAEIILELEQAYAYSTGKSIRRAVVELYVNV